MGLQAVFFCRLSPRNNAALGREIIGRFAGNISENYFLKNLFPAKPLYFSAKPTGVLLVGCAICILAVAPPSLGQESALRA